MDKARAAAVAVRIAMCFFTFDLLWMVACFATRVCSKQSPHQTQFRQACIVLIRLRVEMNRGFRA
jgi:hypothetical protein